MSENVIRMSPVLRLGKCQLIFCLEPPKLIKIGLKHEGVHAQNNAAAQSDTASIGLEVCHLISVGNTCQPLVMLETSGVTVLPQMMLQL